MEVIVKTRKTNTMTHTWGKTKTRKLGTLHLDQKKRDWLFPSDKKNAFIAGESPLKVAKMKNRIKIAELLVEAALATGELK